MTTDRVKMTSEIEKENRGIKIQISKKKDIYKEKDNEYREGAREATKMVS